MDHSGFFDFEKAREHLIFRVINYERNREQLRGAPYLRLNDLAITFRWLASADEAGIATVMIRNEQKEQWGVSLETLVRYANCNTPRLFPARTAPLEEMITGDCADSPDDLEDERQESRMIVLTNTWGINGASCICYRGLLDELSARFHASLFILPSSIHEVILLPDHGMFRVEELEEMVRTTNSRYVAEEERLSDHVYFYDKERKSFTFA